MAQTEKNEYRSERKERLAKSAKKKSKKAVDSTSIASGIIIALCIVALLAAIGGGLYAYGVPQKILPAVKVNDRTYSVADYGYYYTSVYQTYANQSYSMEQQYGVTLGFDYKTDPAAQTTTDKDGNTITYAEFFKNSVLETLESYNHYLKLAKEEGLELSEESKAAIDENINELSELASTYGYSADRYVSVLYGKGLNVKKLRSLLEEQYLVSQYTEKLTADDAASVTMEDIEAKFNEAPADYQAVDLRLFGLAIDKEDEATETTEAVSEEVTVEETTEAETTAAATEETTAAENEEMTAEAEEEEEEEEEEKEPSKQELLAKEMLAKITDEASFAKLAKEYCAEEDKDTFADDGATLAIGITKSTVKNNIDSDLAEWLFDADRQVGDKTVCVTDEYVYVIMMKNTAYRNETPLVSARHILISFDAAKATLEEAAAAEENAEEVTEANETSASTEATENTAENDKNTEAAENTEIDANIDLESSGYDAKVIVEAHKEAVAVLDEFKAGEMTEEAFAALAEKYSADTASIGDKGEGGLYSDIAKGQMVSEFENWVYDEVRQPGDTAIIQTKFGFHVMYFVKANEEAPWIETIRSSISKEKETEREEALKEIIEGTAVPAAFEEFAAKTALKTINKLYISK